MLAASIPQRIELPWAENASPTFISTIPVASQIGVNAGRASFNDGFVPLNFTPVSSGGIPAYGADFNGILNVLSAWNRWQAAGGPITYNSAFATSIGGYPNGAILMSAVVPGNMWMSIVDNNTTDPDAGGANWVIAPGTMGTGHWQHRPVSTPQHGWIISNGTSIGNAASAATQRANADTWLAFSHLWTNFSNTQCAVSGGRGASAAADFAANKTINTLTMQSTGVVGVDGMGGASNGLLAGVPVVSGSVTLPGSILGANLHTLITAELAAHTHINVLNDPGHSHQYSGAANLSGTGTGATIALANVTTFNTTGSATGMSITNASAGSGSAHNNLSRAIGVYWFMHL